MLGEGWITLERYLWARAILHGRAIWWDERQHIVPLLDLVSTISCVPKAGAFKQRSPQKKNYVWLVWWVAISAPIYSDLFDSHGVPVTPCRVLLWQKASKRELNKKTRRQYASCGSTEAHIRLRFPLPSDFFRRRAGTFFRMRRPCFSVTCSAPLQVVF